MAKYHVKVVADGDKFRVLASLPSGVFTSEPMSEEKAMAMATFSPVALEKGVVKKKVPWWRRIFGWWKRTSSEVPPPLPEDPPVCPRHPQWEAEWTGGKWVCSFCRKSLGDENPSSEGRDQKGTEGNVETVRG